MKILKLLLGILICISLVGINNIGYATKVSGTKVSKLVEHVSFDSTQNTDIESSNGLKVSFIGVEARNYHLRVGAERSVDSYWFIKPYTGDDYRIGIAGLDVNFVNTTDHILVIKWSQSTFALGDFYGYPAFSGMSLIDSGKANTLPDTIIPGKGTIKLVTLISRLTQIKGETIGDYEYLRSDGSLRGTLSLKIVDQDGKESYTIAQSPNIIIPQSTFNELGIKIKEH